MTKTLQVRRGSYVDSVALMQVSRRVAGFPGVTAALVAMATELNLDLARQMGFDLPAKTAPNEMLVAVEADDDAALTAALGEVDAALVYRTDARAAAGEIDAVEFPESAKAINDYPIVALKDARNTAGARAFIAYVLSPDGTRLLTGAGFQVP